MDWLRQGGPSGNETVRWGSPGWSQGKPVEIRYDSPEAIPALFAALEGGCYPGQTVILGNARQVNDVS